MRRRFHSTKWIGHRFVTTTAAPSATFCLGIPKLLRDVPRGSIGRRGFAHPLGLHTFDDLTTVPQQPDGSPRPATMMEALQVYPLRNVVFDFNRVDRAMTPEGMKHMAELVLAHCRRDVLETLTMSVSQKAVRLAPEVIRYCAKPEESAADEGGNQSDATSTLQEIHLHISGSCCDDAELLPIIAALDHATGLRAFSLTADGPISGNAVKLLLSLLPPTLESLELPQLSLHGEVDSQPLVERFGAFLGTPARLPALRHLDLSGNALVNGHRIVGSICGAAGERLERLSLAETAIGEVGLMKLAQTACDGRLPRLHTLDLSGVAVSEYTARLLGDGLQRIAPENAREAIHLGSCGLTNAGAYALADGLIGFREVNLRHNRIGHEGLRQLVGALERSDRLERLVLHSCPVGDAGVKALLGSVRAWPALRDLDLTRTRIGCETLRRFSKSLSHMPSLRSLTLARNDLRYNVEESARQEHALGGAVAGSGVGTGSSGNIMKTTTVPADVNIRFADAPFFRPFVRALAAGPAAKALCHLDLSDCCLTERTLQYFTEPDSSSSDSDANRNAPLLASLTNLESMDLVGLRLLSRDVGAKVLMGFLTALGTGSGKTLKRLNLSGVNIGDGCGAELAAALGAMTALEELHLGSCRIGDRTLSAIASAAAPKWGKLRILDLAGNLIVTPSGALALVDALRDARGLEVINLYGTALVRQDVAAFSPLVPPLCEVVVGSSEGDSEGGDDGANGGDRDGVDGDGRGGGQFSGLMP